MGKDMFDEGLAEGSSSASHENGASVPEKYFDLA